MALTDMIPGVSPVKAGLFVAGCIIVVGLVGYSVGMYYNLKEQLADANDTIVTLNVSVATLKANQTELLSTNAANEETINRLLEDNRKGQEIIAEVSAANERLKSRISSLEAAGQKGTVNDGPLSNVLRQTLESLPGATK